MDNQENTGTEVPVEPAPAEVPHEPEPADHEHADTGEEPVEPSGEPGTRTDTYKSHEGGTIEDTYRVQP